jgi:capsular polysaccharide biosynthesis protein
MTAVSRLRSEARRSIETVWHYRLLVAIVFAVLLAISLLVVSNVQKEYVAGTNLLVVNGTTRDDPTLSSPDLPSIATSTLVLERMEAALGLKTPLKEIKHNLSVKAPAFRSSILRIEYTDTQPERAMLISNTVAEQLTKYYRQISTARFDDDLSELDSEMSKQRDLTHKINAQIRAHGVVGSSTIMGTVAGNASTTAGGATDNGSEAVVAQYTTLEATKALAAATLQGDVAQLNALKTNRERQEGMIRNEVLRGDPTYQTLQTSVATSATQLANTRAAFTANYPGLPALASKVDSLKSALTAEGQRVLSSRDAFSPSLSAITAEQLKAEALVDADRAKVAAYDALLTNVRNRAAALPAVEVLRLERDAAQETYLALSARRATALANRADALSLGSVVIVDRAIVSDAQIGLGKSRLLVLLGVLVLVLAISSAFIADQLNPRLTRTSQIEDLYGRPVVATIGQQ